MTRDEGRAHEQGIVDQQDAALAGAAGQAGADQRADETGDGSSRAARAGIVDQQDAALEAIEPPDQR